ncbi:MAG: DUF2630 family protein [Acidimicrobiales bacterium]
MDDRILVEQIDALMSEEHRLERDHDGEVGPADRTRLDTIGVQLDQCWDLLRQRRARRDAGLDPDQARVRPAEVVERYAQ